MAAERVSNCRSPHSGGHSRPCYGGRAAIERSPLAARRARVEPGARPWVSPASDLMSLRRIKMPDGRRQHGCEGRPAYQRQAPREPIRSTFSARPTNAALVATSPAAATVLMAQFVPLEEYTAPIPIMKRSIPNRQCLSLCRAGQSDCGKYARLQRADYLRSRARAVDVRA